MKKNHPMTMQAAIESEKFPSQFDIGTRTLFFFFKTTLKQT